VWWGCNAHSRLWVLTQHFTCFLLLYPVQPDSQNDLPHSSSPFLRSCWEPRTAFLKFKNSSSQDRFSWKPSQTNPPGSQHWWLNSVLGFQWAKSFPNQDMEFKKSPHQKQQTFSCRVVETHSQSSPVEIFCTFFPLLSTTSQKPTGQPQGDLKPVRQATGTLIAPSLHFA
jgi:hypothetical protein